MPKTHQVITLGTTCFARYIVSKAGLKPLKEDGELTMPFDLAVHIPEYIPKIISSNFTNYLKDVRKDESGDFELFYKTNIFSKPKRCAWLNHDKDLNGESNKLIERYNRRIENFRLALKNPVHTFFVQSCDYKNDPLNLLKLIKRKRESKPYSIVLIDIGDNIAVKNADNLFVIKTKYPNSSYVWHEDQYKNSPEGIMFENEIMNKLNSFFKKTLSILS